MKRTMLKGKFVIGFEEDGPVIYEDGQVVFEGDSILYVGHDFDGRCDEALDTGLSIISPGFIDLEADVDTDHAIFDTVLLKKREKPEDAWAPNEQYRTADPYADEDFYIRQKYSMAQLIMNGVTTAMPIEGEQFHGWSQSYHELEIMAGVAGEMGLRAYLGPSFRSRPDRWEPVDQSRQDQSLADAFRFFHEYDNTAGGLIRGFLNPCQISVTEPDILRQARDFAVERDAPMRLHAAEDDAERPYVVERFGKSAVDYFEEIGLLCPQLLIPHAIALKDSEIRKLAQYGVTVVQTPVAEINYGAALVSFAKYRALGVNLAMGTDAQPVDMIQNLRLAFGLDRLFEWRFIYMKYEEDNTIVDLLAHEPDYPKIGAADIFNAATLNGARALGRNDLGRLAPGARADIIVVDLDDLRVGPYEDPLRTLLVSCVGNNVRHTIINGEFRLRDFRLTGADEAALRRDAQRVYEKYLGFFQSYDAKNRPFSAFCPPSLPVKKRPGNDG